MAKRKYLSSATRVLDEAGQTSIGNALRRGGVRTASSTATEVKAGLADRFYRPHVPFVHDPFAGKQNKHDMPDTQTRHASCCPRCKKPQTRVRLANNTPVLYCTHGCRFVVATPESDLVTNN